MWVMFALPSRDVMALGGRVPPSVTPYLQYFVAGVAADDNLVFESVLGLGRLDFPIDGWLHQWAWVSFE